ncbi:MAG: hypothetical protein JWR16_1224 [Nevskia sp.]|nr:hypothetical protein [Nevskia sp.]
MRPCLLVSALLPLTLAYGAAENPSANALRLVKAMEMERIVQLQQDSKAADGSLSAVEAACMKAKTTGVITNDVALSYDKTMKPENIRVSAEFYESTTGRKYTARGIFNDRKSLGLPVSGNAPEYSEEEKVALGQFIQSPAGQELLFSSEVRRIMSLAIFSRSAQVAYACHQQQP